MGKGTEQGENGRYRVQRIRKEEGKVVNEK